MPDVQYDPALGGVGYLTWDEWDRLTRAWVTASKNLPWWWVAGVIRSGDSDEHRSRSSEHTIPLPATYLAADTITRLMQELNQWPELEDAAKDLYGSDQALTLIRETETAAARWPMSDRPHKVRYFRCTACDQMTLTYYPPSIDHGKFRDTAVKCTDKACRAVMDELMFMRMAVLIEMEQKEKDERVRRLGAGKRRAGKSGSIEGHDLPVGETGAGAVLASEEGIVAESA